ncbi:MAG TPA: metal-binding protein [Pyrinomonadaceae bacterium]|jgi:uncharacterized metal-binding protein
MPSGRTHDAITVLLAAPTFAAAWGITGRVPLAAVATAAMLFGGLMFGPDLDILSRQYTRWGPLRVLWWPYRVVFRHRSRWSHGIIFGTLIRVVYFAAVLALLACAAVYLRATFVAGAPADYGALWRAWRAAEQSALMHGRAWPFLLAALAGLWWGAASHTLTDVGWSVIRKGSQIF